MGFEDMAKGVTDFYCALSFDLSKAGPGPNEGSRRFKGIGSTEALDLQNERMFQGGMDLSYFRRHGWFTDEHNVIVRDNLGKPLYEIPAVKVAAPLQADLSEKGLYVEGELLAGFSDHRPECRCPGCRAEYWHNFMQSLARSNTGRKVGLSVEGRVLRKESNSIVRSWIKNIAITDAPVNTETWAELAKSLASQPWCSGDPNDMKCSHCNGCRVSTEATRKSQMDAMSFEQAVSLIEGRGWDSKVAQVVAAGLYDQRPNTTSGGK